jgi:hypothetical protein
MSISANAARNTFPQNALKAFWNPVGWKWLSRGRTRLCRVGDGDSILQSGIGKTRIDESGNSHQIAVMATATLKRSKAKKGISVLQDYDIAADAKNRISLRGAKTKYFHVKALSNGSYVLEPRVLVPPEAIPARTLKTLKQSAANLKKGKASAPVMLPELPPGESIYDQVLPILKKAWARNGRLPRDLATNPKYMEGFGE